jgi:hypothetical protein
MPKPNNVRAAFDAGYCSGKYCRDLVGSGEGIQDYTDPEHPKRFCWFCYRKLEAAKDASPKAPPAPATAPPPDATPPTLPPTLPRRVVVVRRNT